MTRNIRRRTIEFWRIFFSGIVGDIPHDVMEKRNENWSRLDATEQKEFLAHIEVKSQGRRTSMLETATRASFLGALFAFVVAGAAQLLAAPDVHGASEVLLKLGISLNLIAGCIICLAISAKAKVWKRPRKGGFSEPDEMLQQRVEASSPTIEARDKEFDRLHKRKLVLVVERRAQHAAAVVSVCGMLITIAGVWMR